MGVVAVEPRVRRRGRHEADCIHATWLLAEQAQQIRSPRDSPRSAVGRRQLHFKGQLIDTMFRKSVTTQVFVFSTDIHW